MSLKNGLKKFFKKSKIVVGAYSLVKFLSNVPPRDLFDFRKVSLIFTVRSYSFLSYERLSKLEQLACYLEKQGIGGSFVECGVWKGGSAAIVAKVAEHNRERHCWFFDSWEGVPKPTEMDVHVSGVVGEKGRFAVSEQFANDLIFGKLKLDEKNVHLVKGWFDSTIPLHKKQMAEIALLHLDCDFYEPVKFCLEQLYDKVVEGGFIVIDDYQIWHGCRKAVDEFFEKRKLKIDLIKNGSSGVYFSKK